MKSGLAFMASLLACGQAFAQAIVPPDLVLERYATGFDRPLALRNAGDGSNRLFVVEQAGVIWVLDRHGRRLPEPFLDIRNKVDDGGNEEGLLGLAFDPRFEHNGFFYVNYTRDPAPPGRGAGDLDRTVVARYRVFESQPNQADPASAHTLIEFEQAFQNHNGGDLHFGPDGYLYIATGDGGGSNDDGNNAQDLNSLLGKILRIDPIGTPGNGACGLNGDYDIPPDNPFADSSGCDEIFVYGLRNPFRFSFDALTGDLLIADVGQNEREEVNWQPASSNGGENYGWDCLEGTRDNRERANNPACTPLPESVPPVFEHGHELFRSITGGYVYRGPEPGWQGRYIYGDFIFGRIWFARQVEGFQWENTEWRDTGMFISSFGVDEAGNLYLADYSGGTVYRFASELFQDGFE